VTSQERALETATVRGRRAEQLAETHLQRAGYRIVARNHRCAGGEVDIIAFDGDVLCFIEVRARATDALGHPLETIDKRKIRRVAIAARDYINGLRGPWPEMRFDAIGILLHDPPEITLVRGAFEV
jgi:putative endonuclease